MKRMYSLCTLSVCACLLILCLTTPLSAVPVKLGTSSGGMMIYYNNLDVSGAPGTPDGIISGYDENETNQAYIKFQFGYDNNNGSAFQFDNADLGGTSWNDIFSGQPVGDSQFGFDLQATALTYDPAGGVLIPTMDFVDNVDNSVPNAAHTNVIPTQGQGAWAINDYKGASPNGPQNTATSPINSLFRGTDFTMNIDNFQMVGSTYILDISGTVVTDGLIHWYNPAIPGGNGDNTSDLADWLMSDTFTYSGTLIYDMDYNAQGWDYGWNTYTNGSDNGADQKDFYAGSLDFYVDVVPEPMTLSLLSLGSLTLLRRRKP